MRSRSTPRDQRSRAARRGGYLVSIGINAFLLYLLDVHPGWRSVSFLTPDTAQVIGLVYATLWAGMMANGLYVIADPPALHALGDLTTSAISLAAMVRILAVFPFAFHASVAFVATIVQVVLILGIAGAGIGILYSVIVLIRSLARSRHAT